MITGTVVLNLRTDSKERDHEAVRLLYSVPVGQRVILDVGDRWLVDAETVRHLGEYALSHHLDVHGTPRAVSAWIRYLRREHGTETKEGWW